MAGTTVDHGSLASTGVFVEAFGRFGVEVTVEEARGPMGMAKRPHVAAILALPRVAEAWGRAHGRAPTEADVDAVHEVFVPLNAEVVGWQGELVPGTAETVAALRQLGLKIGSITGCTREIMARLLPVAAAQGCAPDCLACTSDAPDGWSTPFMLRRAPLNLAVWPAWACVKVDNTEVGIAEGLNAGAWAVGAALTGNLVGLDRAGLEALPPDELASRRAGAEARLLAAGAHRVVDGVADLLPVVHEIKGRLARGERP